MPLEESEERILYRAQYRLLCKEFYASNIPQDDRHRLLSMLLTLVISCSGPEYNLELSNLPHPSSSEYALLSSFWHSIGFKDGKLAFPGDYSLYEIIKNEERVAFHAQQQIQRMLQFEDDLVCNLSSSSNTERLNRFITDYTHAAGIFPFLLALQSFINEQIKYPVVNVELNLMVATLIESGPPQFTSDALFIIRGLCQVSRKEQILTCVFHQDLATSELLQLRLILVKCTRRCTLRPAGDIRATNIPRKEEAYNSWSAYFDHFYISCLTFIVALL